MYLIFKYIFSNIVYNILYDCAAKQAQSYK